MFIRPALSESNFNMDDDGPEPWEDEQAPFFHCTPACASDPSPEFTARPWAEAIQACPCEAREFWWDGGWDE